MFPPMTFPLTVPAACFPGMRFLTVGEAGAGRAPGR